MFRQLRRKDKKMTPEQIEKTLLEGDYGVMSCIGDDDYGYGVALNYIYLNDAIYFHCANEGHKIDAIKKNDKVSFLVISRNEIAAEELTTLFSSVLVFGKALIIEGDEKKNALIKTGEKFSKGFEAKVLEGIERAFESTCVVKINIQHKEGKTTK